jgi:hypothetical protein
MEIKIKKLSTFIDVIIVYWKCKRLYREQREQEKKGWTSPLDKADTVAQDMRW